MILFTTNYLPDIAEKYLVECSELIHTQLKPLYCSYIYRGLKHVAVIFAEQHENRLKINAKGFGSSQIHLFSILSILSDELCICFKADVISTLFLIFILFL